MSLQDRRPDAPLQAIRLRHAIAHRAKIVFDRSQIRIQIKFIRMRCRIIDVLIHRNRFTGICILCNRAGCLERFLQNRRSVSVIAEAVVGVRQLNRDGYVFVLSGVLVCKLWFRILICVSA